MRGFTLVEFITATTILALIFSIGLPNLADIHDKYQASTSVSQFRKVLAGARSIALNKSQKVTVCPYINNQCSNNWQNPIMVFLDLNQDLKLNTNESMLMSSSNENNHGKWIIRTPSTSSIIFNERGHAFGSATTFLYCPASGENKHARQLIISFQGRIRSDYYLSNQGTPYASLGDFNCPS